MALTITLPLPGAWTDKTGKQSQATAGGADARAAFIDYVEQCIYGAAQRGMYEVTIADVPLMQYQMTDSGFAGKGYSFLYDINLKTLKVSWTP